MEKFREFLKCKLLKELKAGETDREKGLPAPAAQKTYPANAQLINLKSREDFSIGRMPFVEVLSKRKSRRKYTMESLTLTELSYLLWATQGVRKTSQRKKTPPSFRTVPSGGGIHPFETYLFINRVEEIETGLYRYLPLDHLLCFLSGDKFLKRKIHDACLCQYVSGSAVTFIWTVIPYRAEWGYGTTCYRIMAMDAGHVCQNLYLACESINIGACAIGAYDQKKMDDIIDVDGKDEFTIYAASVGRINAN